MVEVVDSDGGSAGVAVNLEGEIGVCEMGADVGVVIGELEDASDLVGSFEALVVFLKSKIYFIIKYISLEDINIYLWH